MTIEDVEIVTETSRGKQPVTCEVLVFSVRPKAAQASRCSRCRKRCPGYDAGDGTRRWRTLDVGTTKCYLQAPAPRVQCAEHGVMVADVPWARPGAKHSYLFEDTCAWLSAHTAISVVAMFLRVAWRTIAAIVGRVVADGRDTNDLLAGLTRIGIDEIAYRKGHRYLTCVIDHTSGRLVWAAEGRNKDTLARFFDELGAGRAAALTHVSCDGAEWIHTVIADRAPQAVICLDPFPVVMWSMKALDKVRVRTTAAAGTRDRHAMWAVRKNPADLTGEQRTSLAAIHTTNKTLYRAYLLRATPGSVSGQRRRRAPAAGRVAVVGQALPHPRVRQGRGHHRPLPPPAPQHPRSQSQQRPLGGHQHPPTGLDQARVRVSQPRSDDRHGHAHPRRPVPRTTRPGSMKPDPRKRQEIQLGLP